MEYINLILDTVGSDNKKYFSYQVGGTPASANRKCTIKEQKGKVIVLTLQPGDEAPTVGAMYRAMFAKYKDVPVHSLALGPIGSKRQEAGTEVIGTFKVKYVRQEFENGIQTRSVRMEPADITVTFTDKNGNKQNYGGKVLDIDFKKAEKSRTGFVNSMVEFAAGALVLPKGYELKLVEPAKSPVGWKHTTDLVSLCGPQVMSHVIHTDTEKKYLESTVVTSEGSYHVVSEIIRPGEYLRPGDVPNTIWDLIMSNLK